MFWNRKTNIKKYNNIVRKAFWLVIVLILVYFLFVWNTYAVDATQTLQNEIFNRNISEMIKMLSHVVYVFIWPCLVIAWSALDNSLIYGSFLHLDAALWNIWNIMKNFANFTLGFLFVFSIVINLFKWGVWKGDPMKNAVDTVKQTLLAWVLVQISWFLVAVLIDLSTVLIYAVGGIPLSMLGSYSKEMTDIPIMKMNAQLDETSSSYYYSYWDNNFAPCLLINKWEHASSNSISIVWLDWPHIAWREKLYLSSWVEFKSWYCTLNGYLYHYEEPMTWFFCNDTSNALCYQRSGNTVAEMNSNYKTRLENYLMSLTGDNLWAQVSWCFLLDAYWKTYDITVSSWQCPEICEWYWEVPYTDDIFSGSSNWLRLPELMEKSKWWVWPFITMYSSILNYQDLVMNPESDTVMWTLFGFIINTFFAFVLFIPIAILMVLLIIRVWYLWVVVAVSPILILVACFSKSDWPLKNLKDNNLFKKFSVEKILLKIFSPVIVVFAVSLCIVFLSVIFKSRPNKEEASDVLTAFGIEKVSTNTISEWQGNDSGSSWGGCVIWSGEQKKEIVKNKYSILWLVDVELNAQNYNHGMDMFVWVLLELIAVWIVWFFMKFAIWMMKDDLWDKLMKQAEQLITNYPIIPIWWWKVGIWAFWIWEWNEDRLTNITDEKINNLVNLDEQNRVLGRLFWPEQSKEESWQQGEIETILQEVRSGNKKYETLSDEQKWIVNNYYWWDAAVAESIVNNIYEYSTDKTKQTEIQNAITQWMKNGSHTNADALVLNAPQLDMAVKNDPTWISWAEQMIWWTVHTRDWVRIVDTLPWTAEANNPIYTIVTRDQYEEHRFGKQVENINKDEFDGRKEKNEDRYSKMNEYLTKLSDEYEGFKKQDKSKLSNDNDKALYDNMENFFKENNILEKLNKLDPTKFKTESTSWWES